MIINCTKKLQETLKIKPDLTEITNPLFSWHANILVVNRRKTLVLVNDSNRYAVILHGLKAKDFKNIDEVILNGIKETLLAEYIRPDIVEKYIADSGQVVFSRTQDRTLVARLNKGCVAAQIFDDRYDTDSVVQCSASKKANNFIFEHRGKESFHPNELFYSDLEEMYGAPIFRVKAVVLKIKLDLEKADIWRRVVVPLNINFKSLHDVINTAFDWGYYHLHEFQIYSKETLVATISMPDDDDIYDILPSELIYSESKTEIADFMPKYKQINYVYDFGDYWQHIIDVEDVIFDYDKYYPVCLEGEGDRPPEDVGGEPGYYHYLEVLKDPTHPEYKDMLSWYNAQDYNRFDIELVNKCLKYLR